MRQKILYLSFLFIMILLLVIINRKPQVVQPISEVKNYQQVVDNKDISLLGENKPVSLSSSKAGITFIKKDKKKSSSEESLLAVEEKKSVVNASSQSSASSGAGGSESQRKTESTNKEESAGITKISKRPTAEKKQQLKDKGILLF